MIVILIEVRSTRTGVSGTRLMRLFQRLANSAERMRGIVECEA